MRYTVQALQDARIQATIYRDGDLIAIKAKYHSICITYLKNMYRSDVRKKKNTKLDSDLKTNESRAFLELISYTEEAV